MTRLSEMLGDNYKAKREMIFTRQFELGGHTFKVRVPNVSETDMIFEKVMNPEADAIEQIYQRMAEPLLKFKDEPSEGLEFKNDDILVNGKSMREAARNKVITETKITEYIRLLVPANPDDTMADITYADIEAEFPLPIQLSLIEKISEVISPTYKESRGN